jgi:hypothetical protein
MAKVETFEIPEHSLILFRDIVLPDDPDVVTEMLLQLKIDLNREHIAFLHVQDYSSKVEIIGPEDSLPDWFYRKLAEAKVEAERRHTPPQPTRAPVMLPRQSVLSDGKDDDATERG